jgi:hypothetical protein
VSVNEHGEYEVAGEPLVFFHFTKAKHVGLDVVRTKWADNAHVAGIWSWYLRCLSVHSGYVPETPWTYGTYWDGSGERIPLEDRRAFARLHAERRSPNPFVLRR